MTIQTDPQYKLRMPPELHEKLKAAAKDNHRSMNAEIVARLQSTLEEGSLYGQPIGLASDTLAALDLDELLETVGGTMKTLQGASEALYMAIRHAQRAERAKDQAADQQGRAGENADDS
ncbi:Arc family DNA-binding protein [Halomonas icarae]|uniref:Arc family DNA-binding protein n=1 Tax=Halomonas icarae TaxID=2691040 RepID=A0A7X4VVZ1_9GAMM|nr:Arc family DNA-binding protein [Halomonas icarae]MDR5901043.1 Arc family DNA-binding protein [Halomonas icarae]NAW11319.1 Arc family DNA-binding protein [Halomonas icarae]